MQQETWANNEILFKWNYYKVKSSFLILFVGCLRIFPSFMLRNNGQLFLVTIEPIHIKAVRREDIVTPTLASHNAETHNMNVMYPNLIWLSSSNNIFLITTNKKAIHLLPSISYRARQYLYSSFTIYLTSHLSNLKYVILFHIWH